MKNFTIVLFCLLLLNVAARAESVGSKQANYEVQPDGTFMVAVPERAANGAVAWVSVCNKLPTWRTARAIMDKLRTCNDEDYKTFSCERFLREPKAAVCK